MMLCTFTTETGNLIIRSDDIRGLRDVTEGAMLSWDVCGAECSAKVAGTAKENRDRIQQEELDLIARIEAHRAQLQARMQQGYPAVPVQRGRQ